MGRPAQVKLPTKGGEQIGPAVIVSGAGMKKKLRACIKELDADVGAKVVIVEVKTGQARFELNIRASQVSKLKALIPSLQNDGGAFAVWEPRGNRSRPGLAGKAAAGAMCSKWHHSKEGRHL